MSHTVRLYSCIRLLWILVAPLFRLAENSSASFSDRRSFLVGDFLSTAAKIL